MSIITEYTYDEYPLNGTTYYSGITKDSNLTHDICLLVAEYISNSTLNETDADEEIQCTLILIGENQRKILLTYLDQVNNQYFVLVKLIQDEENPVITSIHCWKIVDESLVFQITSTGTSTYKFYWTISPNSYGLEGRHQDITDNRENLKLQVNATYYFTKSN